MVGLWQEVAGTQSVAEETLKKRGYRGLGAAGKEPAGQREPLRDQWKQEAVTHRPRRAGEGWCCWSREPPWSPGRAWLGVVSSQGAEWDGKGQRQCIWGTDGE